MKLVVIINILLFTIVNISADHFSFEKPISSEEEKPLPNLDLSLTEEILNPKAGNGDKIHQELFQYYNRLYHIFEIVNQDLSTEKDVYELGKEIYENGGPVFLQKLLDLEKMKSTYQWEDVILEEFQDTFSKVKSLWGMVFSCYKNKAWRTDDNSPP